MNKGNLLEQGVKVNVAQTRLVLELVHDRGDRDAVRVLNEHANGWPALDIVVLAVLGLFLDLGHGRSRRDGLLVVVKLHQGDDLVLDNVKEVVLQ